MVGYGAANPGFLNCVLPRGEKKFPDRQKAFENGFSTRSHTTLNLKTIAAATALASVIAFAPAQAQFVGGPSNVTTVKNLLDSGKDDQLATLEGYIVQQVKHEKYMFRDSTGEMLVEIDDEVFKGQRVDPKTKVRIDGELERDFMEKDKVDVYNLTILR